MADEGSAAAVASLDVQEPTLFLLADAHYQDEFEEWQLVLCRKPLIMTMRDWMQETWREVQRDRMVDNHDMLSSSSTESVQVSGASWECAECDHVNPIEQSMCVVCHRLRHTLSPGGNCWIRELASVSPAPGIWSIEKVADIACPQHTFSGSDASDLSWAPAFKRNSMPATKSLKEWCGIGDSAQVIPAPGIWQVDGQGNSVCPQHGPSDADASTHPWLY